MKHHPAAQAFPMQDAAHIETLAESIRTRGLLEPVTRAVLMWLFREVR